MKAKGCFGILFGLSIVVGVSIGMMFKDAISATATLTPPPIEATEYPQLKDTILILGVDSLESERPLLEGAWLVTLCNKNDHDSEALHFILITLYPVIPENVTSVEQSYLTKAHAAIPIDPNNISGLKEISPLSITTETWSHVIILDEFAMNLIVSLTNPNIQKPYPTLSPNTFIKSWENPIKAFSQHRAILITLCEEPDTYAQFNTIQEIVRLNNRHIKTNLTDDGLINLWQLVNFSAGKKIFCDLYPKTQPSMGN